MGRCYTVPIDAVAATTAVDFFEINSASTKATKLNAVVIGQSTEAGDAMDEQLRIRIITAHSTSGSGGSTTTAQPVSTDAAFAGTCETMNTTVATGGSPIVRVTDAFNVRAGWVYRPATVPVDERIDIPPSGRLVVNLPAAPTDSVTFSGYAVIEEIG